jgi:beta-glucosidase
MILFIGLTAGCVPVSNHPIQSIALPHHAATTPEKRGGARWWVDQNKGLNQGVREANIDLVFLGDSITEAWEKPGAEAFASAFGSYRTAILGIAGDRTQNILWRVEHGHFKHIRPKLVVLLAGTNNVDCSAKDRADGVTRIIQEINKRSPQTRILLMGIFPRGTNPTDPQRRINESTNQLLAQLADDELIHYIDIGHAFLEPDGTFLPGVSQDLLHLKPKGYQIWAHTIKDLVDQLMQLPPPPP